jgi:glycosyltransferase involved in cell wall biosynthesis
VVNEAMAAGLPVIVSHRCGCVPELVRAGVNGYVCDPFDIAGMARLLGVVSSDTVDADKMGEISRQIVALYTPETWAQSLADCIERTLAWKQEQVKAPAYGLLSPGAWLQKQGAEPHIRN